VSPVDDLASRKSDGDLKNEVTKIDFLIAEHGEAVSVMRAIKKAIDPDNIMNPGKILRI